MRCGLLFAVDSEEQHPSPITDAAPAPGPGIAVEPAGVPGWLSDAVVTGGGRVVDLAEADAFATTVYVMGVDGLQWLAERPGYSGCLITRDLQVLSTDDFDRYLAA